LVFGSGVRFGGVVLEAVQASPDDVALRTCPGQGGQSSELLFDRARMQDLPDSVADVDP